MRDPSIGHFRFLFKMYLLVLLFLILSSCNPIGKQSKLKHSNYSDENSITDSSFTWDFKDSTQYLVSDSSKIVVSSGAILQEVDQTHNSSSDFDGIHIGTTFSTNKLQLKRPSTSEFNSSWTPQFSQLVAYWKMNNDWNDSVGSNHSIATTGTPGFIQKGAVGTHSGRLSISGHSVTIADNSNLDSDLNNGFTIQAWYRNLNSSSGDNQRIISKACHTGSAWQDSSFVMTKDSTGNIYFSVFSDGVNSTTVNTSSAVSAYEWNHIVATYDQTKLKLYVNGGLVDSEDYSSGVYNGSLSLLLGSRFNGAGCTGQVHWLNGNLDDIAIWKNALSESEISTIYSMQTIKYSGETNLSSDWTPKYDSLLSYWKMDENWLDSVGTNHGTAMTDVSFISSSPKIGSHSADFETASGSSSATAGYVDCGNSDSLNWGSGDGSIALWFKTDIDHNEGGGWYATMFQHGRNHSGGRYSYLLTRQNDDLMAFQIRGDLGVATVKTNKLYNDGGWHHAVGVRKNGMIHLYIDGEEVAGGPVDASGVGNLDDTSNFCIIGAGAHHAKGPSSYEGQLDDIAIWGTSLEKSEVNLIYNRQKQKYSGLYTAPLIDTGQTSSTWTAKSWVTELPFLKELPGSSGSESQVDYSTIYSTTGLNEGLVGLWHLNEVSLGSAPGNKDFLDSSSSGLHGTNTSSMTFNIQGKFDRGIKLGTGRMVTSNTTNLASNPLALSFSFWIKATTDYTTNNNKGILTKSDLSNSYGDFSVYHINNGVCFKISSGNACTTHAASLPVGEWTHIVGTYDGTTISVYKNGEFSHSDLYSGNISNTNVPFVIGTYYDIHNRFTGEIDEVAVWNRSLHSSEISQLYRRGANRVKMQVRSCDDSSCSGETWLGPDGTASTWFSELNNCDMILGPTGLCDFYAGGKINITSPTINYSDFNSIDIAPNRYFQYRILLESDMESTSPTISSISIGPAHYHHDSPSVTTLSGPLFSLWRGFSAETSGDCSVSYQVSLDKSIWYHHNGSSWEIASSISQASSSVDLNNYATTFHQEVGIGRLYIKAILQSDGTQSCNLNSMKADLIGI